MGRPVHFEIHATDPERLIRFYSELLGWSFTKWAGPMEYWVIATGPDTEPGINGGLVAKRGSAPLEGQAVNAFVCTVAVASLDSSLAALGPAGGHLALPKMGVPGVGWLAYVKDPDGNILGLLQADPAAA